MLLTARSAASPLYAVREVTVILRFLYFSILLSAGCTASYHAGELHSTRLLILLLVGALGFAAPTSHRPASQLQTRELQTRSYDTTDAAMVMKALVNVLQDDSFIVNTASGDIGLVTATKEHTERHWY